MERKRKEAIRADLDRKMVFLTGPRQVGKTTLARSFSGEWPDLQYLNFDAVGDRRILMRGEWSRAAPLVIFDEIHKWSQWKRSLKGLYDTEGISPRILVTGSARLDTYRRGGDSLAGRYHLHRLMPLTVAELEVSPEASLAAIMKLGAFPEPLLGGDERQALRWRREYLERLIREDLRDLSRIGDLNGVELLVDLLRDRVGSTISFKSLAGDLQVSPHTVKSWIEHLERLYIIFRLTPWHRNISRSLLKEPKIYFYEPVLARGRDEGAVLENVAAVSLLKSVLYRQDVIGQEVRLHFIRDREKREVDFAVVCDNKLEQMIEVKLSDPDPGRGIAYYAKKFPDIPALQVVHNLSQPRTAGQVQIQPAAPWLAGLEE